VEVKEQFKALPVHSNELFTVSISRYDNTQKLLFSNIIHGRCWIDQRHIKLNTRNYFKTHTPKTKQEKSCTCDLRKRFFCPFFAAVTASTGS